MTICPKCNKELNDGMQFCDSCGAQIFETIFCPNCGNQTSTESAFCQYCGASIIENSAYEQPAETFDKPKKKFPKKAIIFGGIGVVVVAMIVVAVVLILGKKSNKSESNYALYIKENEIFFTDLKKDSEPWQLTSRLIDLDDFYSDYVDLDNKDFSEFGDSIGYYTYMSKDGRYIFFPDKVDGEGLSLYYKEVAKPEAEAVKIDSDIYSYTVNDSATIVTYLKGEEGNLYQYKIGEDTKDKVGSEVEAFEVSEDGKKIEYVNSENSIYLKYADKDKEKIASDISSLEYVNKDFTVVYYIKDGSLYKQATGTDKVKIASDVYDVLNIYDSGEVYYLKNSSKKISLMDYVTDDMEEADASITEPVKPEKPDPPVVSNWDSSDPYYYTTNDEEAAEVEAIYDAYEEEYKAYEEECERIDAEYQAAYDTYLAKVSRDELRESLEEKTMDYDNYSLCFFNGTEETVINNACIYGEYTVASDSPLIIYRAYNQSELEKVKLSEIDRAGDVEDMVVKALYSSKEIYVAVKNTATVIEQEEEAGYFNINASGTDIYYFDDVSNSKDYGELYHISIANGVVKKPELYDSDVCIGYSDFISDNQFAYFKDYKSGKGDLYINKNEIDYDVYSGCVEYYPDLDKVFYVTDWNHKKEYGTLKVYQNNEALKIADDVHSYSVRPDGRVLYLYDYSLNYYQGELHEWNNGETRKIDDDVVSIISVPENRYQGGDDLIGSYENDGYGSIVNYYDYDDDDYDNYDDYDDDEHNVPTTESVPIAKPYEHD